MFTSVIQACEKQIYIHIKFAHEWSENSHNFIAWTSTTSLLNQPNFICNSIFIKVWKCMHFDSSSIKENACTEPIKLV